MDNFDRTFNVFKFLFIGVFILAIGGVIFRGSLIYSNFKSGKAIYEIKVPDYNGGYTTYLTTEYVEENGCVKFVDEFKFQQQLCNNYNITRWK